MADAEFWAAQVEADKALILECRTAISTVLGGAQGYTLDTGQHRQVVNRANLTEIRNLLSEAIQRLSEDEAMLADALGNGARVYNARPSY